MLASVELLQELAGSLGRSVGLSSHALL
jgi:uncharacterized membrane protein (DUF485 family)